jgi:hypothetical protein
MIEQFTLIHPRTRGAYQCLQECLLSRPFRYRCLRRSLPPLPTSAGKIHNLSEHIQHPPLQDPPPIQNSRSLLFRRPSPGRSCGTIAIMGFVRFTLSKFQLRVQLAHWAIQHAYSSSSRRFSRILSALMRKEDEGTHFWFVSFLYSSPRLFTCTSAEFTRTKPAYYLLTIEPMIEDDYLVYSYLADVFQKPEDEERDASSCA